MFDVLHRGYTEAPTLSSLSIEWGPEAPTVFHCSLSGGPKAPTVFTVH